MELEAARQLALELISAHAPDGWSFRFDRARCRLGSCRYRDRSISLSAPLTELNTEEQIRDTILHEIAHALTPGDGHGRRWRAACKRLGARPHATVPRTAVVMIPAPYRLVCSACDASWPRYRRVAGLYLCGKCDSRAPLRLQPQ